MGGVLLLNTDSSYVSPKKNNYEIRTGKNYG